MRRDRAAKPEGGWLAPALVLGLFAGFALWIHNTSLFICLGIWLGLALTLVVTPSGDRARNFAIFFVAGVLALVVWAPGLPIFIEQSRAFAGLAFWLTPKTRDLYSAWMLILGDHWLALLLALVLLGLGIVSIGRRAPAHALVVAAILLVPLYLVLAVSFAIKPIYIRKFIELIEGT